MKKKSNAGIIVILFLLIISIVCGILGFLKNKENKNNSNINTDDYIINYKYYIDDEQVREKVTQEKINISNDEENKELKELYTFKEYECTNDVTGTWDEDTWTFTPNITNSSTCKLYFTKNYYEVSFTAVNGTLPDGYDDYKIYIQKNESKTINIKGLEGYKYNTLECTNDINSSYDEATSIIKIENVTKDSVCTISYKIGNYKAEVKVSNGTLNDETKTGSYGDNIKYSVTPAENYRFDTVTCTNNQTATYEDNTLTIKAITADTICTIQFKPIKYTVTINLNNTADFVANSTSTKTANEGGSATFSISPKTGYKLTDATLKCNVEGTYMTMEPTGSQSESAVGFVIVSNIKSDVTCNITLKENTGE